MATFKQFRCVYEYKSADGRVSGAGCVFIIATGEEAARAVFAKQLPLGTITFLREEPDDPLAPYEKPVRA